jgi:competence protein ComEA
MKRLLLLTPVLALSMVSMNAQGFPEGPGKSIFENTCGGCHGADIVIGQTGTREVWQDPVDSMRGRGALGTDDDFKQIVSYLTKYFGVPVNVNTAPAKILKAST